MKDIRLRFFYNLYSNNELIYSGYILHEDAWFLKDNIDNYSCSYVNKVKKQTDQSFFTFLKNINKNQ